MADTRDRSGYHVSLAPDLRCPHCGRWLPRADYAGHFGSCPQSSDSSRGRLTFPEEVGCGFSHRVLVYGGRQR